MPIAAFILRIYDYNKNGTLPTRRLERNGVRYVYGKSAFIEKSTKAFDVTRAPC